MPAIERAVRMAPHSRMVRDPQYSYSKNKNIQLTSSALAFIIPIIIMFIVGPVIIVWTMKRRRSRQTRALAAYTVAAAARRSKKIPGIGREEAKARLDGATDVVKTVDDEVYKYEAPVGGKESDIEMASTAERDCAICLSALHAPSPPAPVKLVEDKSTTTTTPMESTIPTPASISSTSLTSVEEILRLKTCAHEFHAECLISWCALGKVSCPICRAVYYEIPKAEEGEAEAVAGAEAAETVRVEDISGTGDRR